MSRRFTLAAPAEGVARRLNVADPESAGPRYNIAPSEQVLAVRAGRAGREAVRLRWGLVPPWASDPRRCRLINARAETAAVRPAFREAFRHRRCLVPADGFYVWTKGTGRKEPFLVRLRDRRPFAFAGLWERWESPGGEVVESCAILTTEANEVVRPITDRMPVIVQPRHYGRWLDPALTDPREIRALLAPYPADRMVACPVSRRVNDARNDGPECIAPAVQRTLF
jgi:putative SOS response-associated peptidase YedK